MYKVPKKKCNLKNDKPVRFVKQELKKRVEFILSKEVCQVCEQSHDLDYPHHAVYGLGVKDDRTLVNICISCHRIVHSYDMTLKCNKSRKEIEYIGWSNNDEYLEYTKM